MLFCVSERTASPLSPKDNNDKADDENCDDGIDNTREDEVLTNSRFV